MFYSCSHAYRSGARRVAIHNENSRRYKLESLALPSFGKLTYYGGYRPEHGLAHCIAIMNLRFKCFRTIWQTVRGQMRNYMMFEMVIEVGVVEKETIKPVRFMRAGEVLFRNAVGTHMLGTGANAHEEQRHGHRC